MTNKPTLEDGSWEEEDTQTTDEANLGTEHIGPGEVETDSLTDDTEPQPATQVEMSESDAPEDEPPAEFDSQHREDFEGLLYIGKLDSEFTWLGHRFHIRTLTVNEILEIGLIHRDYAASLADVKAYQAAVIAGCIVSVDGQSLPVPITNDPLDTPLRNKFRYVSERWFPPVLDVVYEQYLLLEQRVSGVIESMGKVPG